jgi:chromosome partitioning protein
MRKIIVLNQKGGVGKTTTVANLGACLTELGKTVLLVDVDPQANLSIHFGVEMERGEPSLYTFLRGEHNLRQVVRRTPVKRLGLIPSNVDLAGLAVELASAPDRLLKLRTALEQVPDGFDYILMDSPPSLGLLTINAMVAADEVFIPLQTEFFALQGVGKLLKTVKLVQANANRNLVISGVIPCMYDSRTCLANEILADIRSHFGSRVFETIIRKNIRLAEAPGFGVPIVQYDEECNGARDYRALAREVVAAEVASRPAAEPEAAGPAEAARPSPAPASDGGQPTVEPRRPALANRPAFRPYGAATAASPTGARQEAEPSAPAQPTQSNVEPATHTQPPDRNNDDESEGTRRQLPGRSEEPFRPSRASA